MPRVRREPFCIPTPDERARPASACPVPPGAAHADDLGYLFLVTERKLDQDIAGDGAANRMLREHTKLITDFAKTL